jgi:hypothetical protein
LLQSEINALYRPYFFTHTSSREYKFLFLKRGYFAQNTLALPMRQRLVPLKSLTALNHGWRAADGGQVSLSTLIGWPLATYSVPVPPRLEFNALIE